VTASDNTEPFYKDGGSGPLFIFRHGRPLAADSRNDQVLAVAEAGYRAVAYDGSGFRRSSRTWGGYDCDTPADELLQLSLTPVPGGRRQSVSRRARASSRVYRSGHRGRSFAKIALMPSVLPYMLATVDDPGGTDASVCDDMTRSMQEDRATFFGSVSKNFRGVGPISHPVSVQPLRWGVRRAMQAIL
jgi:hypothetical protein